MGQDVSSAAIFILLAIQLAAAVFDVIYRIIPVRLVIISAAAVVVLSFIFYKRNALNEHLLGGIAALAVMAALVLVSRRQIGGGDLALMAITGFFAGSGRFFAILFLSVLLSGMYSLILIITGRGTKKTEVPFAPFIMAATAIAVIWVR